MAWVTGDLVTVAMARRMLCPMVGGACRQRQAPPRPAVDHGEAPTNAAALQIEVLRLYQRREIS